MRSKSLGESDIEQKLGQSFTGQGLSNLKISPKNSIFIIKLRDNTPNSGVIRFFADNTPISELYSLQRIMPLIPELSAVIRIISS
jgi:hypothetical protein